MRSKIAQQILDETPPEVTARVKAYGDFKVYEGKIRTLGLYQPFAGLMFHGKIETRRVKRGKKAPFPLGKYLLYATQKEYNLGEVHSIAGWDNYDRIIKIRNTDKRLKITEKALMIADLVSVFQIYGDIPETFVKYNYDEKTCLWGLVFRNVQPIEPFYIKGKQGIAFLAEDQKKLVKFV